MILILASNSPRRRQLLALGGWKFTIIPAEVDERPLEGEKPREYVIRLAETKARSVVPRAIPGGIVVAADTTVVDSDDRGEYILGKPADAIEAKAILRRLRGRKHQVYTALAVLRVADGALFTDWCVTEVPMRNYSDAEISLYVASGDPMDKAGAYAIQNASFNPVENLYGCYANVMGLPLCHLTRTLVRIGLQPQTDIPTACQDTLHYQCPVYPQILQGNPNLK